ncbi:MAG: cobalamin biosynthesis protein CobD [Mogibacterium sp.]|nr:cobalamin biosynthesis protein CobD [Mogibacterium sp.]
MRVTSLLQYHMIAFAAGFVMDLVIGDPHNIPHPIRWIGRLIGALDKALLGDIPESRKDPYRRNKKAERIKGTVLVLVVIALTAGCTYAVMFGAYTLHPVAGIAIEAILTCYLMALTSLRRESMKVYNYLKRGNVRLARKFVSMIVGRDTEPLDETGITKAAVETVAENFSDGVIAPMVYTAIGGPVLGLAYKAINTMDSMVGYKNDRYMWFGTPAAKLDDVANYIPSRFSALLLLGACAIMGGDYNVDKAFRIWKRDRRRHKSPNAAQTESVVAGALGIRLAGSNYYFGKLVEKPYIGDDTRPVEFEDIKRTNSLVTAASFMGWIICLIAMAVCL